MEIHYVRIIDFSKENPFAIAVSSHRGDIINPFHDYASIVINFAEGYLIHGGLSCDCIDVYSKNFAIKLMEYKFVHIDQKHLIP